MDLIIISGWEIATKMMEAAGNFLAWITLLFSALSITLRLLNWRNPVRFIRVGWVALTLIVFTSAGLISKYIVYDEMGISTNGQIYPISDGMIGVILLISLILLFITIVLPPIGKKKVKEKKFFCPKCEMSVIENASVCPHCQELIKINWTSKK